VANSHATIQWRPPELPASIKNPPLLLFIALFLLYIVIGSSGYGNDWDTYGLISAGRNLVLGGDYYPSRAPGYFIPELVIGGSSLVGNYYLTNTLSALLATFSLVFFWRLLSLVFAEDDTRLLTLLVAFNPVFVIAATSTIDYVYSIFFIIAGVFCYVRRLPYLAGMLFALGIGSRLSNSIIVSILCLYFLYDAFVSQDKRALIHVVLSMCLSVVLTLLFYAPAFIAADYSLAFITYYMADFNWLDHLARFVYKNVYLFGVLPVMVIAYAIFSAIMHKSWSVPRHVLVLAGVLMVLIQELLFFKIPLEMSYLLPLLFVLFPLWFLMARPAPILKNALLITTLLYGFVFNIELLDIKYNAEGTVATSARVSPSIRQGVIIRDMDQRKASARKYFMLFNIQ
jgi:hypothetical protein